MRIFHNLAKYIIKQDLYCLGILKKINNKIYVGSSPDGISLNIDNKYNMQFEKNSTSLTASFLLHNCQYNDLNLEIPSCKEVEAKIRFSDSIFGDSIIIYDSLGDYKKQIYTRWLPSKYCPYYRRIHYKYNKPVMYLIEQTLGFMRHKTYIKFKNNEIYTIITSNHVDRKRHCYIKV